MEELNIDEAEVELRTYICDKCGEQTETPIWSSPVYNGYIKTDEEHEFWPSSIKCGCGSRKYEEGSNPMGDGSAVMKFDHSGKVNTYMQIKHRPRGM